jgi:hypothetical protein
VEGDRTVDTPGRASVLRALTVLAVVFCSGFLVAQPPADKPASVQQLVNEKRWTQAVSLCEALPSRTADDEYACGRALAGTGRLADARLVLLRGHNSAPRDVRFPTELGGLAFLDKNYSEAAHWMLCARRLTPNDQYVNDFLGTVLFLNGNLEAALKYWNKVRKPNIEQVQFEPKPRLDPVLLDRAIAIAPGTVLTEDELLATQARLHALGVFTSTAFQLKAEEDGKFDLAVHAHERNGFGADRWEALLAAFGGVFYSTVTPEYYNVRGTSTNITSLLRWDAQKRRATLAISGPIHRKAQWRYRAGVDLRDENWLLANYSSFAASSLGSLNMRRAVGFVEVESINSGRWNWRTGAEVSHRDYRSIAPNIALGGSLLAEGIELKHTLQTNYSLIRVPEHHYFANVWGSSEIGRVFAGSSPVFAKFQGNLKQNWSASASGDDYELSHQLRAGRTIGDLPFDELFMLGLERDNDLMMRAHIGTRDGRKGSAPLGSNYIVSNLDFDKKIWSNGLITVKAGPFLDAGKITASQNYLGTREWLYDTGAQLKVEVLGVGVRFTYGRDLRTGNNAFYAFVSH